MNIGRGYQGQTTLSDGQVFVLGGSWSGPSAASSARSGRRPANWRELPTCRPPRSTPPTRRAPTAPTTTAGSSPPPAAGSSRPVRPRRCTGSRPPARARSPPAGARGSSGDEMNGNAVLYDVDKILTVGGAPDYQDSNATNVANVDRHQRLRPDGDATASMNYARAFANSVVLPTGQVFTVGGETYAVPFSDADLGPDARRCGTRAPALDVDGTGGRTPQLSLGGGAAARRHGLLGRRRTVRLVRDQPPGRADLLSAVPLQRRRLAAHPADDLLGAVLGADRSDDLGDHRRAGARASCWCATARRPTPSTTTSGGSRCRSRPRTGTPTSWPSRPTPGSRFPAPTCCSRSTRTARRAFRDDHITTPAASAPTALRQGGRLGDGPALYWPLSDAAGSTALPTCRATAKRPVQRVRDHLSDSESGRRLDGPGVTLNGGPDHLDAAAGGSDDVLRGAVVQHDLDRRRSARTFGDSRDRRTTANTTASST